MRRYPTPPQPPPTTNGERLFRAWWSAFEEEGYAGPEWLHSKDFAAGWQGETEKERGLWELAAKLYEQSTTETP